jgi:dTDP-4-amino-4,6-dideoxygalactose transaminase/predicted dehydrogenase
MNNMGIIRAGIIGTGDIAREHAKSISMIRDVVLVAAADIERAKLESFCSEYSISKAYNVAERLIDDRDIDLVVIATPPVAHEQLAVMALDAERYVLCEKPLAHNLASALRVAEAESRHPGRLTVGYQYRYGPEAQRLLWLCRNGWIGEPQSALIEHHSFIPEGSGGWWGNWGVAGGGVVITKLIHDLDLLLLVMGRPVSVTATVDTRFVDIESEDYVEATIWFSGGRLARCIASVNSGHAAGGFSVTGESGSVKLPWDLRLNQANRQAQALRELNRAFPDLHASSHLVARSRLPLPTSLLGAQPTNHTRFYKEIVGRMKNGEPAAVNAQDAISSLELCMAIYESGITGREIEFPVSPRSVVYSGITKEVYDKRRRRNGNAGIISQEFLRALPRAPVEARYGARQLAKNAARLTFDRLRIQPATIKSLLLKPGPVHGGPPVRRWPWPRRRYFDHREKRAVMRVVNREIRNGGAIAYGGAETKAYCEAFARFLGGGYAHAVNSGSNAIYVALRALDLEPGSEVVVPPITDPGGVMPVPLTMCIPVPADSQPGSILTSAEQIKAVLSDRTSAIVVAHMGGHPVDMDPILELAAERGISVVEDCAQAHGAVYRGRMVGTLGTIAAFSTMFGKQHSTGGQGGVVFTKDPLLLARAKRVADRGKPIGTPYVNGNVMAALNFNQDEISMAIGCVQLAKLPASIKMRRAFAERVAAGLEETNGISLIGDSPGCTSSFWYLMMRIDQTKLCCDSTDFAAALTREGIGGAYPGYSVYPTDQPWYKEGVVFGRSGLPWSLNQESPRLFELPNAHQANRITVSVGIHESLRTRHADELVKAITKITRYYRAESRTLFSA